MKKANILKVLAFGLVLVMVLSLLAGCGKTSGTSDVTSDDDEFADAGEYVYDNNLTSNGNRPTNSGSGGNGGSHSFVSYTESHVNMTDNTEIFKNIPTAVKGKTVKFADWGEALADRYQLVVKQFEKDTGIKVKTILYEEKNFISNVAQQIAAGNSPDIAASNSTFPQALEVVQPLPSIFNVYDGFWDERVSEATQVGSKQYFVNTRNSPFTGGYVVYYNKRIFNNNGLTTPDDYYKAGKWTYENLYKCMQDASKVTQQGGILEAMTIAGQAGVSMISYNSKTGTFSGTTKNPMLTSSIQFMTRAVEEQLSGGITATGFASGKVGVCMVGTYGTKYNGYFKDMSPADIGVLPLPDSYNGKKLEYMPLGYRGYGICKGAKNAEAAYYFLRYFLDLDKYEGAGANIFANKVLEKYFRETQLVLFQNSKLNFEYFQGPLSLIGKSWSGGAEWAAIRHAATNQVAVELEKVDNIVQTAVSEANKKVKEYT